MTLTLEELQGLGLTPEVSKQIFDKYTADVIAAGARVPAVRTVTSGVSETEFNQLKTQMAERDKAIETLTAEVRAANFRNVVDAKLHKMGVKDALVVRKLLDPSKIQIDNDGMVLDGLDTQVESIHEKYGYLFNDGDQPVAAVAVASPAPAKEKPSARGIKPVAAPTPAPAKSPEPTDIKLPDAVYSMLMEGQHPELGWM